MNCRLRYIIFLSVVAACMMSSCKDNDFDIWGEDLPENAIRIGGIDTDEMMVSTTSRATGIDAEKVSWLVAPLTNGLDITYGLYNANPNREDVAILKLDLDTDNNIQYETYTDSKGVVQNVAKYTFRYRNQAIQREGVDNEFNAIWYDNGYHYFQGVHVPERIRYTESISDIEQEGKAPGLTSDQHDATDTGTDSDLGNYTLLSHYLGMPANYRLTATVERIKLPFRHRLARVVAFVLIDPELRTTLKGYKKDKDGNVQETEDPNTTSIRFCNVKVLQGVKDVADTTGHHTLTPQWKQERKVVPHFDGERGSYSYKDLTSYADNFYYYYKEGANKDAELYPTSDKWSSVHAAAEHNGYRQVDYGKVPVYDIIVRPTYVDIDNVMYDEENYATKKTELANQTNKIDFEIELENGLRYEKEFEFDLNANYQTVVYLRISREHVDYNAAGSELWVEQRNYDDYYGVDNANGNTLSLAGSSWQRAFRTKTITGDKVTDGDFYNNGENVGQYLGNNDKWVELLLKAYEGGDHHGDYFVLDNDITIDATKIPKDFVFTGHLDAQDHTITISNVGAKVYKDAETLEGLYTKSASTYTEWSIPTLYVKHVTPATYWTADDLQKVGDDYFDKTSVRWVEDVCYTQTECDAENSKTEHHPKKEDSEGKKPGDDGYVDTWDMENYVDGYEPLTTSTVKTPAHWDTTHGVKHAIGEVKTAEETTYPEATAETTPAYPTTLTQLKTGEYYTNQSGTRFECPALYQYSHESQAYLFAGLDGEYTTAQETDSSIKIWEANVHKEKNKEDKWVPVKGYRAEVLNARMVAPATLFKDDAIITGNVQNCYNSATPSKETAVTHSPSIPQYK